MALPAERAGALLTLDEAAAYLRVSPRQVRYLVEKDGLPWVPVGKRAKRFRQGDLDAWAENRVCQRSISQSEAPSTGAALPSTGSVGVSRQVLETLERLERKPNAFTRRRRSVAVQPHGGASVVPLLPRR